MIDRFGIAFGPGHSVGRLPYKWHSHTLFALYSISLLQSKHRYLHHTLAFPTVTMAHTMNTRRSKPKATATVAAPKSPESPKANKGNKVAKTSLLLPLREHDRFVRRSFSEDTVILLSYTKTRPAATGYAKPSNASSIGTCNKFNAGRCVFDKCKYNHACFICQQNHPATACPGLTSSTSASNANLVPVGRRIASA